MRHSELVVPAYAWAWSGALTVTSTPLILAPPIPKGLAAFEVLAVEVPKPIASMRAFWLAMNCKSLTIEAMVLDLPSATCAGQASTPSARAPVHSAGA